MSKVKRKAPQKECPECSTLVHARVSFCRNCNHTFYVKKNVQQELLAKNWRDLQAGDIIKAISGSGPYFLSRDKVGERIMLGQKGNFEVLEICDQGPRSCGILARQLFPRGRKSHYREYIYMGESFYNEDMSTHMEPHKIKVIKKLESK